MTKFDNVLFEEFMKALFLSILFKTWIWHHQIIIHTEKYFKFKGSFKDQAPWETDSPDPVVKGFPESHESKKNKENKKDEAKKGKQKKNDIPIPVHLPPLLDLYGKEFYLRPSFVNEDNIEEFLFHLKFIWMTHMRNPLLEIYFLTSTESEELAKNPTETVVIEEGCKKELGVRLKTKCNSITNLNLHSWGAFEPIESCDGSTHNFYACVQAGFNSFYQNDSDKKNFNGQLFYGLLYYLNSFYPEQYGFVEFTDRYLNKRGLFLILYCYYYHYYY